MNQLLKYAHNNVNVGCDTHLPLHQTLTCVERQHNGHILAQYCYRIRFFVQRETGFHSEELLQRQRRLRVVLLEAILGVPVELQMQTI